MWGSAGSTATLLSDLGRQAIRSHRHGTKHKGCTEAARGEAMGQSQAMAVLTALLARDWLMPCCKRVSAAVQGIAGGAGQAGWYLVVLLQRLAQASVC